MWDAFITYKSEDQPWAERLYAELTARDLTVFFDKKTLVAGQSWEQQITTALAESRSLVVLWSTKAAAEDSGSWTAQERYLFDLPEVRTLRVATKPAIFVLLDADSRVLGAKHHVTDLKEGKFYVSGQTVPPAVWTSVGDKVLDGIDAGRIQRIKTLVVAARRADLTPEQLGAPRWKTFSALLLRSTATRTDDALQNAGASEDPDAVRKAEADAVERAIQARYDNSARAWKPYGKDTADALLRKVANDLKEQEGPDVRLENVDQNFASDDRNKLERAAKLLAREVALILIDPLSVYDLGINNLIGALGPSFLSEKNAIIVPALLPMDDEPLNMSLRKEAETLFRAFFEPPIPRSAPLPSVGLHVRSPREFVRVLRLALGRAETHRPPNAADDLPYTRWLK